MAADENWDESEEEEVNDIPKGSSSASKKTSNFLPLLLNFVKRKGWIVGVFAIASIMAALLVSRRDPSTYLGKFEILVEPVTSEAKRTDASVLAGGTKKSDETLTELDYPTQLRILNSPEMLKSIAEQLHQKAPKLDPASIVQDLTLNLKIQRVSQGTSRFDVTKIIEVTYEGTNADWVQLVLETTARRFMDYSQQERKKNLDSGTQFIDRQLQRLKQQINLLQDQQENLQRKNNLIDPQTKGTELSSYYSQSQQKKRDITAQLHELQRLAATLEKDLGFNGQAALIILTLSQDPEIQSLLAQSQKIDGDIALKLVLFQDNSPIIKYLRTQKAKINQLLEQKTQAILQQFPGTLKPSTPILTIQDASRQKQIQALVDTQRQINSLQNSLTEINHGEQQIRNSLQKMPSLIKRYQELERQIALNINLVDQLSTQRESLLVEKAQKKTPWQIISPPSLPRNDQGVAIAFPPNPKKKLILGVLGGLVLGLLVAFVIEKRQNKIFSTQDLELQSGLPVLGKIPEGLLDPNADSPLLNSSQSLIEAADRIAPFLSELYLDLHFRQRHSPLRTLLILAPDSEPYQAAIATSFARIVAHTQQQVLLVDANVAAPEIHNFFALPSEPGLLNLLSTPTQTLATIQKTTTEPYLWILPIGSVDSSSSEVGVSTQFSAVKDIFVEHYDLVIINSPTFSSSIEFNLLAEQVEGILMMIRRKEISPSDLKQVMQQVEKFDLPLLGFIELS